MNKQKKQIKRSTKALLAMLLGVCIALMHNSVSADGAKSEFEPNLWIVKEGKHTSVILRTQDTEARLPLPEAQTTQGPLVMIGWGDAAYFQTQDKTLALTLKALLLPTKAALNARSLSSLNDAPQTRSEAKLYPLSLKEDDLDQLLERIASALVTNGPTQADGLLAGVDNAYVGGRFYPAQDRRYSLLFTCNNWVADVLKAGDLRFSSLSSQTAGNLILQHKLRWLVSRKYRQQTRFRSIRVRSQL